MCVSRPRERVGGHDHDLLERRTRASRHHGRTGMRPSSVSAPSGRDDRAERVVELAARERREHLLHRLDARRPCRASSRTSCSREDDHGNNPRRCACSSGREVERERLAHRLELLGARRPDHDRGQLGHAEQPRDREAGHRDAALARLGLERLERVEGRRPTRTAGTPRAAASCAIPPGSSRRAGSVPASQPPAIGLNAWKPSPCSRQTGNTVSASLWSSSENEFCTHS